MRCIVSIFTAGAAVAACSSVQLIEPAPCRAEGGDCSPQAVQARILAAFPAIEVAEVLECVSRPSETCYSTFPDEEACLIKPAPGALGSYPALRETAQMPGVVAMFMGKLGKSLQLVSVHEQERDSRRQLVYRDGEQALAVLAVTEVRCVNVEEII